jgi:hypothetical protein
MGFSDFQANEPTDVQAEQLTEQRSIITPNGPLTGQEGDWEVREPGGNVRLLTDDEFQEEYGEGETKSLDSDAGESVYDSGETGSYSSGDEDEAVTNVDDDETAEEKADKGAHSESDEIMPEDSGTVKTGEHPETEEATPPPSRPRRPPR